MKGDKQDPNLRTADQPPERFIDRVKLVAQGIYQVGQIIVDGIVYKGTATKKEHDDLMKKLKQKKK